MSVSPRLAVLRLLALSSLFGSLSSMGAAASEAWDGPAFSVPAAELAAAARKHQAPAEAPVDVLFLELVHSLDAEGRWLYHQRVVYRILEAESLDTFAVFGTVYSPWYQARPRLRARVISPSDEERWFDEATIEEAALRDVSPTVFTDRMQLRGPLPGVVVGSVIETEIEIAQTRPFFAAGEVQRQPFRGRRFGLLRVVLETPAAAALSYRTRLLPEIEPRTELIGERRRRTFEYRDLDLEPSFAGWTPPDVHLLPTFTFTNGASWADVAREYATIVDATLEGADLASWVREARRGAKGERAVIERLTARLHEAVRYTGVEFDEASIVPRSPTETLARGFGDCKDKATLLVGLLRQAGIPAHVALLHAGEGTDIEPELPGLGLFNHAIVYVPGPSPLWIDATANRARVGGLPALDQDRLALIAAPETKELLRSPASASTENVWRTIREVFLAEHGKGKIVEQTRASGAMELSLRSHLADQDDEGRREWAKSRAVNLLLAQDAEELEFTAASDFADEYRTRFVARQAGRTATDLTESVVAMRLDELMGDLPEELYEESEAIRDHDLALPLPHVLEWTYLVHPAPGFVPRALPPNRERELGTMKLSQTFALLDDGGVRAEVRFDTGKRRLTPAEAVETRRALRELMKDPVVLIYFDQLGHRLLAEGRVQEAVVELRRLAEAHAEKGVYQIHLAQAYLAAGLGAPSKGAAREATRLSPLFPAAWSTLAWILQHDELGRRLHEGFDRAGAIAAYRKALELDSSNAADKAGLAILLEYDAKGERYAAGEGDLAEAEKLYREARGSDGVADLDANLLINLSRRGRHAELEALASSIDTTTGKAHEAAAMAATGRLDAAIALAREISDIEQRGEIFTVVGQKLLELRRYEEASKVYRQVALATNNSPQANAFAELLGKLQPVDAASFDASRPDSVLGRLFSLLIDEDPSREAFEAILPSRHWPRVNQQLEQLVPMREQLRRQTAEDSGIGIAFLVDLMTSALQSSVEGSDELGYRVRVKPIAGLFPMPFGDNDSVFVVREDGTARVVSGFGEWAEVAEWVLDLLDAGNLAAARQWLDWAREEIKQGTGDDPLDQVAFPLLWRRGVEADLRSMKVAAAALALVPRPSGAGSLTPSSLASERALKERGRTELDTAAREGFNGNALGLIVARLEANRSLHSWPELIELSRPLLAEYPDSRRLVRLLAWALANRGEVEAGREVVAAWRERSPDREGALRLQSFFEIDFGDIDSVEPYSRALVESRRARPADLASLAWSLILRGEHGEALEFARQGDVGEGGSSEDLHTLATALAEVGSAVEAYQALLQSVSNRDPAEPEGPDWYVLGRIAETYGLPEAARDYYRRVEPPGEDVNPARATRVLAERRLAALETPPVRVKKRKG